MGYLGLRLSSLLVLLWSLRFLPIGFMSQLLFVVLQGFEALHHAVSGQPGLGVMIPALNDGGAEDAQALQEGSGQVLHPGQGYVCGDVRVLTLCRLQAAGMSGRPRSRSTRSLMLSTQGCSHTWEPKAGS